MAYASKFGRGYLTGFNTITTVGAVTVGGDLTISGDVTNLVSDWMRTQPVVTSALTNADQRCYAAYLGRAPRKITTCDVSILMGATAAVTVVYAELALATGAWEPVSGTTAGTPLLTLRAGTVASIAGDITTINTMITKTLTPTVPIPAGTELWAIVSVDAGTQPVWRAVQNDVDSVHAYKDATRPSTMAADAEFTGSTNVAPIDVPHISLHIAS